MKALAHKERELFERLCALFAEDDRHRRLRERLAAAVPPCIPYMGTLLSLFPENIHSLVVAEADSFGSYFIRIAE